MFHYMLYFKNQSYVHQVAYLASASCFNFSTELLVKMTIHMLKNTETLSGVSEEIFYQIPSVSVEEFFLSTLGKIQLTSHLRYVSLIP